MIFKYDKSKSNETAGLNAIETNNQTNNENNNNNLYNNDYNNYNTLDENDDFDDDEEEEEPFDEQKEFSTAKINIELNRIKSTQLKCCVCQKKRATSNIKQRSVSSQAIANVYILKNVIIPFGSRACVSHFNANGFLNDQAISSLSIYSNSTQLNGQDFAELLSLTRKETMKRTLFDQFEDINSIPNQLCVQITGKYLFRLYLLT
jgi:hypothetical protein